MEQPRNMFAELNQRLAEAKADSLRQERLRRRLGEARAGLESARVRLQNLEARLQKEDQEAARLEGLSLQALFYTVLGSKEEQLDRERQQALAARLQFEQARFAVQAFEQEVAGLEDELARLGEPGALYEAILAEKERRLAGLPQATGTASGQAAELARLVNELALQRETARELAEAVQAGQEAEKWLAAVIDALHSAGNWGTWDLLGGGFLATLAKHSRIDEAREAVHTTQQSLQRFKRELADVGRGLENLVDLNSFETFADYFFDGLIIDWVVQSRIEKSLDQAVQMHRQVNSLVEQLERQLAGARSEIGELNSQKQALLEGLA